MLKLGSRLCGVNGAVRRASRSARVPISTRCGRQLRSSLSLEKSMIRRLSIFNGGRAAIAGVMVFMSAACATGSAGRAGALQSTLRAAGMNQPRSPVLTLNVTNRGWSNVVVYLADGATPRRLGSVPPLEETQMVIYRGSGTLRLLLRPT